MTATKTGDVVCHEVKTPVTRQRLMDLLVSAIETVPGEPWCELDYAFAPGITLADFREAPNSPHNAGGPTGTGKYVWPDGYYMPCQLVPWVDGCALIFASNADEPEFEPKRLDLEAMKRGLDVMASKYPHHFKDWLDEGDDAITADVWLQCAIFGEIVYG